MEYIIGIAVSLLVQWVKSNTNLGGWKTIGVLLVVSLFGALIYTYLVHLGLWSSVANILVTAGAFYTFIIQRFESK
jgi:hypothetical protein